MHAITIKLQLVYRFDFFLCRPLSHAAVLAEIYVKCEDHKRLDIRARATRIFF